MSESKEPLKPMSFDVLAKLVPPLKCHLKDGTDTIILETHKETQQVPVFYQDMSPAGKMDRIVCVKICAAYRSHRTWDTLEIIVPTHMKEYEFYY